MPPAAPTVRSLARLLRLSRSTISAALRGGGRVAPATVQRVRHAAEKLGYRHNPLAATLMSELRRSRGGTFRGVVATIELHEADRPGGHGPFHREMLRGALEGATKLGFKLEQFVIGRHDLNLPRLDTILQSRGIHGLLLMPTFHVPNFSGLSWDYFSAAYTDYNLIQPALHSVCSDHYSSMLLTLERLHALGYRRPGLFIEHDRNERLHRRHTAAFQAYHENYLSPGSVPLMVTPELSRPAFEKWFRRCQPDVVLSHFTVVLDWMEACGARVPETHGFVCLNAVHKTRACATLDLQPQEIGSRGIELIVAQLHRNELGIPRSPTRMTIPARWIDGPTVRR